MILRKHIWFYRNLKLLPNLLRVPAICWIFLWQSLQLAMWFSARLSAIVMALMIIPAMCSELIVSKFHWVRRFLLIFISLLFRFSWYRADVITTSLNGYRRSIYAFVLSDSKFILYPFYCNSNLVRYGIQNESIFVVLCLSKQIENGKLHLL